MPYGEQSVNSEQTGGETPPLQILVFVRRGYPKAPLREGGGAVRRQGESAQLRNSFLFWIPPAKLWVRQLYNFPHFAKSPQFRVLPHPLTREPLLTQSVNVGGSLEGDQWSPENNPPFRLSRQFSAKSQKTPFFSRVDRSTNFRKRLDTGRETCYNVLTCRGAAFSPSRAGSAARGFNAGRLG